jgi:hypothetical protein
LLTVNGKAKLVVQDAAAYERLIEQAARKKASGRHVKSRKKGPKATARAETAKPAQTSRESQWEIDKDEPTVRS